MFVFHCIYIAPSTEPGIKKRHLINSYGIVTVVNIFVKSSTSAHSNFSGTLAYKLLGCHR